MMATKNLTYAGRRRTMRDTLAYFYANEDGILQGFKKPLVPGLKIGTIVRLTFDDDEPGAYYAGGEHTPVAIGQAEDVELQLRWSIQQEADVALVAQLNESKRIAKQGADPIRTMLEPIRTQLAAMSSDRRSATIGWIITYLQSGQTR